MTALPASNMDRVRARIGMLLSGKGIFIALAIVLVVALFIAPNLYAQVNISNTLRRASILGIVTIGQMLLLMVRGVDLSVAALAGLTAVAVTTAPNPWLGVLIALGIGVVVGSANAWLVVRRGVPAFLATFGMVMVIEGAKLIYTRGALSAQVPEDLIAVSRAGLGPIPAIFLVWLAMSIAATVWVRRTANGRRLVLSGASPRMAELSGVSGGTKIWLAFVVSAALAVIGGALLSGFSGYVDRSTGAGLELDSITAAILGGARFRGGEGSFAAAMAGVLLLSVVGTLIVVLGLPPELRSIVTGSILVLALIARWPALAGPR